MGRGANHHDGTRWGSIEDPFGGVDLYSVAGIGGKVWVTGYRGTRGVWEGQKWSLQDSGASNERYGVWLAVDVWAVGENATILRGAGGIL